MIKNKNFSLIVIAASALILALGFVAFAPVDTASAAEATKHSGPRGGRHGLGSENTYLAEALGITVEELQAAHEEARSNFEGPGSETDRDTLLAEALGISIEELTAARETARQAAIEAALAEGKITEEQVALMEARQALKNYIEKDALFAKALGMTVEDLETAKENGQRIPDLLEELGIEQEDFQANMQAEWEAALQQAVEDGVVTQAQADQILENGFQGKRGFGGHGRFPDGRDGSKSPRNFTDQPGNSESEG